MEGAPHRGTNEDEETSGFWFLWAIQLQMSQQARLPHYYGLNIYLRPFSIYKRASQVAQWEKDPPANAGGARRRWKKKWQPTPAFLPGESHPQRSLVDPSL